MEVITRLSAIKLTATSLIIEFDGDLEEDFIGMCVDMESNTNEELGELLNNKVMVIDDGLQNFN